MIDRVEWLHVSDLHVVAHGDEFSQAVAINSLVEDVRRQVDGGHDVSFVLVTGDVAFSGQPREYERAGAFLSDLASAARVPPQRFFFVPGNHDVARTSQHLAYVGATHEVTSQPAVDRLLGKPEDLSPLIQRQAAFWAFVTAFTSGQERAETADRLAYVAPLLIDGLRVSVLGLNSAWLSGSDREEMRLAIGERQVINALDLARAERPQVLIATAHHPIEWLHEWDQSSCRQRLLPEAHFYLRGHLHLAEVSLSSSPEKPCLSIAAGSGHATRFYSNSYNLIELDLGAGRCTVRAYAYDPTVGRYLLSRTDEADVLLGGSLPGSGDDLVRAFATAVPSAEPYAAYLADLITGEKVEIPVQDGGTVRFQTPTIASVISPGDIAPATGFLGLRNLLQLYDEEVPVAERLGDHRVVIEGFVGYLSSLATQDGDCAARLTGIRASGVAGGRDSAASPPSYTAQLLADLRDRSDWTLLATQAARFVTSPDPHLARLAKAALAEALIHSDEAEKRADAVRLSQEAAARPDASSADFLLAATCSEVVGEDATAIDFARRALIAWPKDAAVETYARGLALRTGDAGLRIAVDKDDAGGGL